MPIRFASRRIDRKRLGVQFGGGGWTPAALGSSLIAWWDAERSDLITESSGLVSSWRDVVGGYDAVQAVGASKPAWSATSFNGRPGLTFDGVDDELVATRPSSFPSGATAGWIWSTASQDAADTDATTRAICTFGGTTSATRRQLNRFVSSGNRAGARIGDGASVVDAVASGGIFFGPALVVAKVGATATTMILNGNSATSGGSVVPSTGTNGSVGLGSSASGLTLLNGKINALLLTLPLAAAEEALLTAYLNRRL